MSYLVAANREEAVAAVLLKNPACDLVSVEWVSPLRLWRVKVRNRIDNLAETFDVPLYTPKSRPRAVAGALLTFEGNVLTARRSGERSYSGCWELPGGKVDNNETPGHALVREWKEEMDLDIAVVVYPISTFTYQSYDVILHLVAIPQGEVDIKLRVHDEIKFVTLAELRAMDPKTCVPSMHQFARELMARMGG